MRNLVLTIAGLITLAISGSAYFGGSSAATEPVTQAGNATPNNTCAPGEDCQSLIRAAQAHGKPLSANPPKAHKPKVRAAVIPAPVQPKPKPKPVVHRWSESAAEGRLLKDTPGMLPTSECTGIDTAVNGEHHKLSCIIDFGYENFNAADVTITGAHTYHLEITGTGFGDDLTDPVDPMPSDPAPVTPEPVNPDDYNDHDGTYNGHPTTRNFGDGAGSVGLCADGTESDSVGRQGACSHHGGVR